MKTEQTVRRRQILLASGIAFFSAPVWIVHTPICGIPVIAAAAIWKAQREFLLGAWVSFVPLALFFGGTLTLFATGWLFV